MLFSQRRQKWADWMELAERLARERRARLAAERMLEWKSRELAAANEKLALQARALSEQVVEERQSARAARTEAERLKGQNTRYLGDLDRAHTVAVMAERRLRMSVDTIRDGFAVFDADSRLLMANRAWTRPFGTGLISPGMPYPDLLALVAPLLVLEIPTDAWIAQMQDRITAEQIPSVDLHFASGLWVRLEDRRARDGDRVSLAIDITAEMRLRAAIEAIPDGFALFDRSDRLVLCNQRFRDIYPLHADLFHPGTAFDDILRGKLAAGLHADAIGREEEWLSERLAERTTVTDGIEQVLTSGLRIRARHHPTPDGGWVGLRTDITAEHDARQLLLSTRTAAEAASRAKSAFLANMSHEIRTPMNGIVGMAELLCDTSLTEEQRLFAETIRSSGEALLCIINDVLDYSKIEAGRLVLRPEPFDLELLIHETTMLMQPQARSKGLELHIDYDPILPTRLLGDPGRFRQVLTNLIGNAVKFTHTGQVLIRIRGGVIDPDRCQMQVQVEDTGIGIAPEHLDMIFGEFDQVEDTANRRFEGTGLGLAITKRLVDLMGGTVSVTSRLGAGSCFTFAVTLPLAQTVAPAHLPTRLQRVLVMSASLMTRTILDRQLAPCGIAVVACRSADDMASMLAEGRFDLILIDHEPDHIDATAVVANRPTMCPPIVVLADPSGEPTLVALSESGQIAALLTKPVLRADLYATLSRLTGSDLPTPTATAQTPRRAMRVLAAEDNRTNQLVLAKMVRDLGLDLVFADNGRQAVDLWQSFKPDLIFMDISMPEMDGCEAARAIRAAESGIAHVPILALTAHAMDGDADRILAAGIDRHMSKPLRKTEICQALAEFCPAEAELRAPTATAA
jgi:signal transduction histidine kinase/DNA-binding response OmpR family regulator